MLVVVTALAGCERAGAFPPQYRTAFLSSCQVQGESEAHCACVFDKVEQNISREDFEALDRAAQMGEAHPLASRIAEYSAECRAS